MQRAAPRRSPFGALPGVRAAIKATHGAGAHAHRTSVSVFAFCGGGDKHAARAADQSGAYRETEYFGSSIGNCQRAGSGGLNIPQQRERPTEMLFRHRYLAGGDLHQIVPNLSGPEPWIYRIRNLDLSVCCGHCSFWRVARPRVGNCFRGGANGLAIRWAGIPDKLPSLSVVSRVLREICRVLQVAICRLWWNAGLAELHEKLWIRSKAIDEIGAICGSKC